MPIAVLSGGSVVGGSTEIVDAVLQSEARSFDFLKTCALSPQPSTLEPQHSFTVDFVNGSLLRAASTSNEITLLYG